MKYELRQLILLLFAFSSFTLGAQIKKYELKKGQAFDILLLNTNPDAKETLDRYFKSAIPVGQKNGYTPQKGFKVERPPLQGNYWPAAMIIGLWEDYDKRENFVTSVVDEVPDFHEMRREIWTTFNLTYWKVAEDKEISVDAEKFNVVTAYWKSNEDFDSFNKKWLKEMEKSGGKILLSLTDGTSPFGYNYDPEILTIVEWENEEAFNSFYEKNIKLDHSGVKHVNQFIIQ